MANIKNNNWIGKYIHVPEITYNQEELQRGDRVNAVLDSFGYLGSDSPHHTEIKVSKKFSLRLGYINVICGPSGSGKSSILKKLQSIIDGSELIHLPDPSYDDYLINLVGKIL